MCAQIKEKEKTINLLFLSQGVASFDRSGTFITSPTWDST
jgi:hypothetical protein